VALGWGYQYDSLGRVMKAKHGPWVTPDTIRTVTYDAASEVVGYEDDRYTYGTQIDSSCTRGLAGDPCPDTSNVQDITVVRSGSYGYDSVGNRKDSSSAGGLDPGNRLRRWHYLRMDYDGAGNLTRKRTLSPADTTKSLRTDSLFWGALGRVDSAHTRDSLGALTRVGFGYDGWGRRIRKSTVGGTSRYVWDGHALAMELDTLGHRVAEYTYYPGTDSPESVRRHDRQDTTYYYLQDGLGRVVALLKRTGTNTAIANRYAYDPFGAPQGGSSTVPNTIQFAGREYDAETQLYYNRARYYDPTVGRFVSEDPAGLGAGINPYMYAANDPVNGRDPSGMFTDDYDGMKNREWRLMRFRGPHISPWGALLDLHGMLDDIAMVGVPHYQEPVHYASMQEAVMGGCDINGGGGIPSGAGTAAHPNPNGPNCTATSLTGTEPTSGPPFDKCFSQYFDVMLDAVAVGVSAPFAIADPEPISRIAGAAGATVALGALKKDQDRWMKCEGH
jgi:RHS repeat-associated protein